jgi:hypothetical protein
MTLKLSAPDVVPGAAWCMPDDAADQPQPADVRPFRSACYGAVETRQQHPERYRDLGEGHAAGWCLRQLGAAEKLEKHWRGALPLRGLPRSFGDWGSSGGTLNEDQVAACQAAWTAYDTAMGYVERDCGHEHAGALRMVVVYKEPSRLDGAWRVREALTFLADHWGLDVHGLERR